MQGQRMLEKYHRIMNIHVDELEMEGSEACSCVTKLLHGGSHWLLYFIRRTQAGVILQVLIHSQKFNVFTLYCRKTCRQTTDVVPNVRYFH